VLNSVPGSITLLFTEQVTPAGAGIKVFSPSGNQVALPAVAAGSVLVAALHSTEPGSYVVTWQVFAADTHPSRGAFGFEVGHSTTNPYSGLLNATQLGTTSPLGVALQAFGRWVHFVGFSLVFGVVAYQVAMRRKERLKRLIGAGVVLLITAEPIGLLAQLASLSFDGDTAVAILSSGFGRLLALRLGAALLVWVVLSLESPWPVLGIGAVMAALDGASAHAVPGFAGVGAALTAAHVIGLGLWVGGVAAYVFDQRRTDALGFGRYAAITFSVAAISGLVLAVVHTNLFTALANDYAYVLMLKVLIVGGALAAVLLRRHRVELGVMAAILGVATILAALPPPS